MEMIGGKLHTVSKLQVRLKREATVSLTPRRWADMAYYECSIEVEEEAVPAQVQVPP